MFISYDYDELIFDLKNDLKYGLIEPTSILRLVRGKVEGYTYRPIIDYYLPDEEIDKKDKDKILEEQEAQVVLYEMEQYGSGLGVGIGE